MRQAMGSWPDLLFATPLWTHQQERLLMVWMKPRRKHVQASLDVSGLNHGQKACGQVQVMYAEGVWNLA